MDPAAQQEWDALNAEHVRLEAELDRLKRKPGELFDFAAHHALAGRLAEHRQRLAAWREAHLPGRSTDEESTENADPPRPLGRSGRRSVE